VAVDVAGPKRRLVAEWPAGMDTDALIAAGRWRPSPFRQFLLKVHSRCNLACDYCYVYTLADQTWRSRPRIMAPGTLAATARRIAEHVDAHRLESARVILHGGEPLLAGRRYLADAVALIRDAVGGRARVDIALQTNGVLLDEDLLLLFRSLGVQVGVSVDGTATTHDQHRTYPNGQGSHEDVARALALLGRADHRDVYGGLLCTIDLASDPVATYEALLEHEPPAIDLLLPHGNWSAPPPGRLPGAGDTPYADWLVAVFDRWYGAAARETGVRLFEEIMHLILGGTSATEAVGLTPTSLVVIETDGSIEQTDALKSAYDGAPATGLHVARDGFDAALGLPEIAARQLGLDALGEECRACGLRQVCGGGLYAHRYRAGSGFRNPSVYCPDLYRLITHIADRVRKDVRAMVESSAGLPERVDEL
jgi:uncharacterized protein